jgi:hypothetical protein
MLTPGEIRSIAELVADLLRPALAPTSALLTKEELAQTLRVSAQTIDRQVRAGMPVEYVGDLPRFDLAACRAWLATRPKKERPPATVADDHGEEDLGPIRVCRRGA